MTTTTSDQAVQDFLGQFTARFADLLTPTDEEWQMIQYHQAQLNEKVRAQQSQEPALQLMDISAAFSDEERKEKNRRKSVEQALADMLELSQETGTY